MSKAEGQFFGEEKRAKGNISEGERERRRGSFDREKGAKRPKKFSLCTEGRKGGKLFPTEGQPFSPY